MKMADLWRAVSETFWSESFWFPRNYSWKHMINTDPNVYKPQLSDLWVPVYLCGVLFVVRLLFERCVGYVVGRVYKLKSVVRRASQNPHLEAVYCTNKAPSEELLEKLSKQTDMKVRQIERWFRIRRHQDRTPVLKKFCESSWRCTYYAVIFCYGLYTLWDKVWLWDTRMSWIGWPEHHVSSDLYWYYAVQSGFYLSLSMSLFTDHKRKDFAEMIVHHMVTLGLMFFSWMNNFTRIGSLVLLVHDCADPVMEAAKMAKYVKKENLCTVLFVGFGITWIITRLTLYPFRIVWSTMFESVPVVGICAVYYVYNTLLIILQILHIIWFYYIAIIARDGLFQGKLKKDSRSSDESISGEESGGTDKSWKGREMSSDMNGLKPPEHNSMASLVKLKGQ